MDILSDKQAKFHTRKLGLVSESETLREKLNLFFIAAQGNAIMSNYVKARIEKTQQNCRCR